MSAPMPKPSAEAALLTPDDVAGMLKTSRRRVLELARRETNPLPVTKLGNRTLRFSKNRVLEWANAQ